MTSKNLYSFIDSFSLKCSKYLTLSWVSLRCQSLPALWSPVSEATPPCAEAPDCWCCRIPVRFSASLAPGTTGPGGGGRVFLPPLGLCQVWTGQSGEGRAPLPFPHRRGCCLRHWEGQAATWREALTFPGTSINRRERESSLPVQEKDDVCKNN